MTGIIGNIRARIEQSRFAPQFDSIFIELSGLVADRKISIEERIALSNYAQGFQAALTLSLSGEL